MNFAKMKLASRLAVAFGFVVMLGLLGNAVALIKLAQVNASLEDVVNDNNVKLQLSQTMSESVHIVSRVMRTVILLDDDAQKATERQKIVDARAAYDKARDALEKFTASEAGKAKRAAIDAAATAARQINSEVIDLGIARKDAEAIDRLRKQAAPANERWQAALDDNIKFQTQLNAEQFAASQADYASAKLQLMALALASVLVAAGSATLVVRGVVRSLGGEPGEVVEVVRAVAAGDLTRRLDVKAGDRSSVMAAIAAMQASLSSLVSSVRENSENVATASSQIAQGNQDLSQRTEEQASALQQTAATMEQLGSTVRNTADSARQANQLAQGASTVAAQGGEVVGKVVDTMQNISDSSRKIGDIIGVIDGIAFQTNILALNAAVEAARAGEQGRGFAVVASEVRSLAQRSAEAAKEIKSLIGRSVEQVEQGTELVDQAGKTMGDIVGSIQRVADIVAEITSATVEQSSGIQQVGNAVGQMDQVTQQNAALVEESAAAAESLKGQAQQLVQTVSTFKLAESVKVGAARAVVPTAPAPMAGQRAPSQPSNPARPALRAKAAVPPAPSAATDRLTAAPVPTGTDDWSAF